MPRLVAISSTQQIVNLAFNVNEDPSRAEIDQALIDNWTAQYDQVLLISDDNLRAEPGDSWDGAQGVASPFIPVAPSAMPVQVQGATGVVQQNEDNLLLTSTEPRLGTEVVYGTHNFADPTTWYGDSVRVVDEVASDSGDGLTWSLANLPVVDMTHGKIFDEEQYTKDQQAANPSDPHGYAVVVTIDGVEATPREPFSASGGDYEVDYLGGKVVFFNNQAGKNIQVSYSYATTSYFYIVPDAGCALDIEKAKAMFSKDFIMNDSVRFEVWGLADVFAPQLGLPSGTKIQIQLTEYHTLTQLIAEAAEYQTSALPASGGSVRGFAVDRYAVLFRYGTIRRLSATSGVELRIRLKHDIPMGGEYATATFYCVVRSPS